VRENHTLRDKGTPAGQRPFKSWLFRLLTLVAGLSLWVPPSRSQEPRPSWQSEVTRQAQAQNWDAAIRIVDREAARVPQDMDVRAWRARLLTWSGRIAEAEKEYLEILKVSRNDPDNWMGLSSVYSREGRVDDALRALDRAVELDPQRADLHSARARVLRAQGEKTEARKEFQKALNLDPGSAEARAGLLSLRGEPKHELRFGQNDDLFNFTSANHDAGVSLLSQWTAHWATSLAGNFYERAGVGAGKFSGAITGRLPRRGSLTAGGAVGHDNAVIPKSEFFFDLNRGWKVSEERFLRALEFDYGQHWYWYQSSRILTLNATVMVYLSRDWAVSLGSSGVRSAFSGTGAEWRPSGMVRLGFPLANWGERRLAGNAFFAAGSEDFAQIDQIGRFASHTYGGGLRFRITERQDVTGYASYQKRTLGRTDTNIGLSYGIHF
jgi:tetratricopeptide (TPR) repeat protein